MSGGLDSTVCLRMLLDGGHSVHCLMVNYGQTHSKELWYAERTCKRWRAEFTVIDLPKLGGLTEENWVVPNRNCILLGLAVNLAVQAKADTVTIGCNKDDADYPFPDCQKPFLDAMNATVKAAGYTIEICAPFLDWSKAKIARLASDMRIGMSDIWTCYKGSEKPCGKCPACKKLESAIT